MLHSSRSRRRRSSKSSTLNSLCTDVLINRALSVYIAVTDKAIIFPRLILLSTVLCWKTSAFLGGENMRTESNSCGY